MTQDEQIIQLLQEIRDLQKQNVENYQNALRNQREAISMQQRAMRRIRWLIPAILIVLVCLIPVLWSLSSFAFRCLARR